MVWHLDDRVDKGEAVYNLYSKSQDSSNGRYACHRNMISTRAVWGQADLWSHDDDSGRQEIYFSYAN